jgi:SAM-dependent methyltransferase
LKEKGLHGLMDYRSTETQPDHYNVNHRYRHADLESALADGQLETAVCPDWEIELGRRSGRSTSTRGQVANRLKEIEEEFGGRDDEAIVGPAAEQFESEAQSHPERYESLSKWFLREISGSSLPRSIIDVGCGPGILTRMVAKELPDTSIIGLDISPDMLRLARQSNESDQVRFLQGDVRDSLDIAEHPVDAIVSRRMIHRVEGLTDVLSRMIASVEPAGGIVLNYSFRRPTDELGQSAFIRACDLRSSYKDLHAAFIRAVLNAPTVDEYIVACSVVANKFELKGCDLGVFPFDVSIAMMR